MAKSARMPAVGLFALIMLAVMWLAIPMPQQFPALDQIQLRQHAIERHRDDALEARRQIFDCKLENLRWRYCPPGSTYGSSVVIWCQPPGRTICPGMYVTLGGIEKTSFFRPCEQWGNCQ